METDDPDTPGPGGIEINFPFLVDDAHRGGQIILGGIDANLGIGERLQLRMEQDLVADHTANEPPLHGHDQTSAALKYRFFDQESVKIAVYPSFAFNDASRRVFADGSTEVPKGGSFYLPVILAEKLGSFTLVENLGFAKNVNYKDRYLVFTSVSVGHAVSESLRLLAEIASSKNEAGTQTNARVGLVKGFLSNPQNNWETALFGSVGQSLNRGADGFSHSLFEVGFTLARKATGE